MSAPSRINADSAPLTLPEPEDAPRDSASDRPDYGADGRSIYWLRYYILMVTRRRRPFFEAERARARCSDLMREIASRIGCEVVDCTVRPTQVIVEVLAPPAVAPHSIATRLRHDAAAPLKAEFPEIEVAGGAFAHPYMVTTVPMPEGDSAGFETLVSRS